VAVGSLDVAVGLLDASGMSLDVVDVSVDPADRLLDAATKSVKPATMSVQSPTKSLGELGVSPGSPGASLDRAMKPIELQTMPASRLDERGENRSLDRHPRSSSREEGRTQGSEEPAASFNAALVGSAPEPPLYL
jgi:hypothetical protein